MRLDEQIRRYVCETLSLWPPFKPWNCGYRISRERLRFRFGQSSWSKWCGSVIIEVDIHERPCSTEVSKNQRKINVRRDNQSGTLMTLKNFAGFYYVSLFLGLITSCCSGKWAPTHCPPPSAHPSPPPLKELFGEDQWLDLKDSRNWAQYGHSSDDYLIGWWCSIYCWPSLLHYQFKGDVKGRMLFEKRCNRLAGVVYLFWGEGTVTGLQ